MLPPATPPALPPATVPGLPTGPDGAPASPASPRYSQTWLVLDEEGEERLRERIKELINESRREMGLDVNLGRPGAFSLSSIGLGSSRWSSGFGSQADSWAFKREVNQKLYDGDLEWRKSYYPGSIFGESNYSLNPAKRWVRLLNARLNETQLLTDPFFASIPQQTSAAVSTTSDQTDPANMARALNQPPVAPALAPTPAPDSTAARAKAFEAYVQKLVGKSNLRATMQEARRAALVRNDATVKESWVKRISTFYGPARVMVAPASSPVGFLADNSPMLVAGLAMADGSVIPPGEPVRLADGRCVYEIDAIIPAPPGPSVAPGAECLLKDPTFILPPQGQAIYQNFENLEQVEVDYEGLDAATVFFKDYLFPVRCRSLKEADFHCHVYDATPNEMAATYAGFETFDDYYAHMTSEVSRARPEQGEQEFGSVREYVGVHECYVLFDADGDGKDEWIFCPYDHKNDRLIFYDYLKNHMRRAPFVMLPGVEKIENRAFGTGIYEMARD